jgi:hypothetical protein
MTDRETMQRIMQVLGPAAVCECSGCSWETNEAIRLLEEAGIAYQQRSDMIKPEHFPARERLGDNTSLDASTIAVSQIKQTVCKRCGCVIDVGMCGYTCDLDGMDLLERPAADIEIRTYSQTSVEPFTRSVI